MNIEDMQGWYHNYAVVDVVAEFMDRGYDCYLEYAVPKDEKHFVYVDACAVRGDAKVLIEVSQLAQQHRGDRVRLLKKLVPNAKVLHITTFQIWLQYWENAEREAHIEAFMKRYGAEIMMEMGIPHSKPDPKWDTPEMNAEKYGIVRYAYLPPSPTEKKELSIQQTLQVT
jgi:hypothetical protein